jgi:hypothetical protein
MDGLSRKRALEIILDELSKTKEEPRMEEEQEGPEIEIELPAGKMGRSNRLERAFKKVDKYNAI